MHYQSERKTDYQIQHHHVAQNVLGRFIVALAQTHRHQRRGAPILILMGIICLFFSGLIYLFLSVSREDMGTYSTLIANILLFSVIILFILTGLLFADNGTLLAYSVAVNNSIN